jgi:hypothetical protein
MINVACFKQRTPDEMDFDDAGKADYNIQGSTCRRGGGGMVAEKPRIAG